MRRTSVCSHAESPALHCLSLKITFIMARVRVCVVSFFIFFFLQSLEASPPPAESLSLSNRSRYTLEDGCVVIDLIQIEKRLMTGRYTHTCVFFYCCLPKRNENKLDLGR